MRIHCLYIDMRFSEWLRIREGSYGGSAYGPTDDLTAGGSSSSFGDDVNMPMKGIRSKYKTADGPGPSEKRKGRLIFKFNLPTSAGTSDWPRF